MSQASAAPDSKSQPALLHTLTSLKLLAGGPTPNYNLAERLGDQINLSDSIALARALMSLDKVKLGDNVSLERPQRQFLNARGGMIRFILRSFEPGETSVPFMLPATNRATLDDPTEGVKPYLRFYSLHQSEMDHRVSKLRKSLRCSLALDGPPRSRLAALDRIVDDTFGEYGRHVLGGVTRLLGEHFSTQRQAFLDSADAEQLTDPAAWTIEGGWIHGFQQDMQQLLLAELDLRLLPARALLDALETQDKS